jgi:hypothetical protein
MHFKTKSGIPGVATDVPTAIFMFNQPTKRQSPHNFVRVPNLTHNQRALRYVAVGEGVGINPCFPRTQKKCQLQLGKSFHSIALFYFSKLLLTKI